ncbi:MAG: ribbon-helix-helix domain-containing protein [Boseongicola sp.]
MAKLITANWKRGRGRPATGRDPTIAVRMPAEFIDAVDRYRADENPPLSRSEAVRRLLGEHLRKHGYLVESEE